jgi:C4-dicarboxylate-binding protein DctP
MNGVTKIAVGGYAPSESTHGRALAHFATELDRLTNGSVEVDIVWNVMDHGRPATDLFDMVEQGDLLWCYFSTSYLGDRVPELDALEQPFLFADLDEAHAALDGELGDGLTQAVEAQTGFTVLGYWDNGFRHLTNRLRPVRTPDDVQGMRVRLQPNRRHEQMITAWGGEPVAVELSVGIDMIKSGQVDAQENPLANTVAYGVDEVHRYVTMTGHLYGARGVFANRAAMRALPRDVSSAVITSVRSAVALQRAAAEAYENELRRRLEAKGLEFIDLTTEEKAAFRDASETATAP